MLEAPAIHGQAIFELQRLEDRKLLSAGGIHLTVNPFAVRKAKIATVGTNINLSKRTDNEAEGAIAVDPHNPLRLFALSNIDSNNGLSAAFSSDGGRTWNTRIMASGSDGLPAACCDGSVSFDSFGNLYVGYINAPGDKVEIVNSTDGGQTFKLIASFAGKTQDGIDQPTVTTGHGMLWVTYQSDSHIVAGGAKISGLGKTGSIHVQTVPSSTGGNYSDIAIGPSGQVAVVFENPSEGSGPAKIYFSLDADGLGSKGFGKATVVTSTNVGGFDYIPPQHGRSVDAEPGVAFDTSSGAFRGRMYLVYTDEPARDNTDIMLRYSRNNGSSWSKAIRVNDDTTKKAQFLPRVAVDPTRGTVGLGWYDSRAVLATQAQSFVTVGTPTTSGISFAKDVRVSAGTSDVSKASSDVDYGDYTDVAFYHNVLYPIWSDNSNSTGDNPSGAGDTLDLYTAHVSVG